MKNKYIDLVEQSFEFPQDEFRVEDGLLYFHDIPMMDVIGQYGTPLKISYLPRISSQIQRAKRMFNVAMAKVDYQGDYHYCYCTKSSHFSFVLEEALKNDIHIETSSAFDFNLIESLYDSKTVDKDLYIICNGYKKDTYISNIAQFINDGWHNTIPVLDNMPELDQLDAMIKEPCMIGIRIAAEEEPKFDFYTSRLGIRYKDIVPFYQEHLSQNKKFKLKMLHFFINTGIKDNAYYWNELGKCVNVYCNLKAVCPDLDSLNIGGGLPIKNSLGMDYDYEYMVEEVVAQIKSICNSRGVEEPNIFTEFGSYTVGESGATIFSVLGVKQQNDREKWYMVDSSFMTTLPDIWGIKQKFILLPINNGTSPTRESSSEVSPATARTTTTPRSTPTPSSSRRSPQTTRSPCTSDSSTPEPTRSPSQATAASSTASSPLPSTSLSTRPPTGTTPPSSSARSRLTSRCSRYSAIKL